LPDFFGLCPRRQKHFPEKLSKIVVDGGGGGSDYEKFLLDSIFTTIKIDRISHKIDRICPIYFYNKPILPYCEASIARLDLFAQRSSPMDQRVCWERLRRPRNTEVAPPGNTL
jgi:hypothetical protein